MAGWLPFLLALVMLAQGVALAPTRVLPGLAWRGVAIRIALPLVATGVALALAMPTVEGLGLLLAALAPPAVGALPLAGLMGANVVLLSGLVLIGTALAPALLFLVWGQVAVMPVLVWVILPFALGFALRNLLAPWERTLAMAASVASGVMVIVTLWRAWGDPLAAPDLAAIGALLVVLAGGALAGLLGRGQSEGDSAALLLSALIPVPAVPIGLAAAVMADDFAAVALPAALTVIAGYALAIGFIILRLRARR